MVQPSAGFRAALSGQESNGQSRIRDSVSVQLCLVLILIYVFFGIQGADVSSLNLGTPTFVYGCPSWQGAASYFVQNNCLVMEGWVWMLFTSLFLHASILHLGGNLLFLLIFGTSLEEKVSRQRWLIIFLASGVSGNVAFLVLGPLLGANVGLGASGAIYGLLGAAAGLRGALLMIFLLGLNLFAGGGEIAHVAGLLTGLAFHRWGDRLAQGFKGSGQ
jgi:membrane associated rhomboid family serine protease